MALFRRRTDTKALSSQATGRDGTGCLVLFGLVFGTIGMFGVVMVLILPMWEVARARDWTETPCTIQASRVESHTGDDGDTYSVVVSYVYQAPDPTATGGEAPLRTWAGDRYSFSNGSSSGSGAKEAVVAANPPGHRRTCWVDPRDPRRSVLERDATGDMWVAGGLCLIFPLVGYGLAIGAWMAATRRRERERILSAGAAKAPAAVRLQDGVLRPGSGQSPWIVLIASLVFCAFWNGIVSVFLFGKIIPGFHSGNTEWFLGIFLIPFVLVGLALFIWVGYNLLALANPRIRLRIDATTLRPGDRACLSWDIDGSTSRLRNLTITLEGREEATYTRGTNQVTDKEVFYQAELVDTGDRLGMQQGRCDLVLPADIPTSFQSRHNRLRWAVVVHGDIPRWPDIQVEWDLEVTPPLAPVPAAPLALAGDTSMSEGQNLAIILGVSPDGHVAGTVAWDLPEPPTLLELRLFWYTSGRGTRDVVVTDSQRLIGVTTQGRQSFDLALPHAPRPFAGKLVAITWALELVAEPGGRVARLDLPHQLPLAEWAAGRPIRSA